MRIPVVGTLFAGEEVVVSTKVAGILRRTFLDVAGIAKPDAPLAQVDPRDYEAARAQAQASLAEALARLGVRDVPDEYFDPKQVSSVRRASAQLENARVTYTRLTQVADIAAGKDLDDAAAHLRVAEMEYQLALNEAAALAAVARDRQAALQIADRRLTDSMINAPPIPSTLDAAGAGHWVVAARMVTEGQYVNVADPLYRLIVVDPLKLRCKVPERYAANVRPGQSVRLDGDANAIAGRIIRVSPAVDPSNRTFELEAIIRNDSGRYRPGGFVKGEVIVESAGQSSSGQDR